MRKEERTKSTKMKTANYVALKENHPRLLIFAIRDNQNY